MNADSIGIGIETPGTRESGTAGATKEAQTLAEGRGTSTKKGDRHETAARSWKKKEKHAACDMREQTC